MSTPAHYAAKPIHGHGLKSARHSEHHQQRVVRLRFRGGRLSDLAVLGAAPSREVAERVCGVVNMSGVVAEVRS